MGIDPDPRAHCLKLKFLSGQEITGQIPVYLILNPDFVIAIYFGY
jgi:hypothetical protein